VKLSTRSRYGTRLMVELAKRYKDGFVQLSEVSKNQSISLKYLEQIVIPLKRAQYIRSARGAGGGYMLAKPPEKIRVGEIVVLLERGWNLVACSSKPEVCDRYEDCLTREVWKETERVMLEKLNSYTLSDLITLEAKAPAAEK
jgi:Rrf2 family iron-sulfur cluster assembly transcriptional regulator